MTYGASLLLIAVGAILRYAITAHISGVSLATIGLILMIVGLIGLVMSIAWLVLGPRHAGVPRDPTYRDRDVY